MDIQTLHSDIKEIKADVKEISVTLARNTESLIHHSARTEVNERRVAQVEGWILRFLGVIVAGVVLFLLKG